MKTKFGPIVNVPKIKPHKYIENHFYRRHGVTVEVVRSWSKLKYVQIYQAPNSHHPDKRYLYITQRGAYVINEFGVVITAYPRSAYNSEMLNLIATLKAKKGYHFLN